MGVTPVVLNEAVEAFSLNKTESLSSNDYDIQYSAFDNLQLVTKRAKEIVGSGSNPSHLGQMAFQVQEIKEQAPPMPASPCLCFHSLECQVQQVQWLPSHHLHHHQYRSGCSYYQDAQGIIQDIRSGVLHAHKTLW